MTATLTNSEIELFPVTVTQKAIDMALAALAETGGEDGEYLRISVKGGGCAGFQYSLNFVDQIDSADIQIDLQGLCVVVDIFTANLIEGTVIDYQETLQGAGFKFENPNAKRTCGCGSSFSG